MSQDKSQEKEIKLSDAVIELAKKIEASIKIDATGKGSVEGDPYGENLPEGITLDTVKKVAGHNANFVAAGAYAFGRLSVEAMAKDKKLDKTTLELGFNHRDTAAYNVEREHVFTNRLQANAPDVVKHGYMSVNVTTRAGSNGGQLKQARAAIVELGLQKLK
jgi:hypothetical protein